MKKFLLPAVTAGAIVAAAVLAPPLAATAAPAHTAAKPSHSYTLSVTGNGKHAAVVWTTASVKKGSTPKAVVHTVPKAHEPWVKHVKSSFDLYEIVAIQTTGSKLHCTIKNTHGTVIASSYSRGKNTIVTCIVAKDALLTGLGGTGGSGSTSGSGSGSGSTSGSSTVGGSSTSSSLLSALR